MTMPIFQNRPVAPITPIGENASDQQWPEARFPNDPLEDEYPERSLFPINTKIVGTTFAPAGQKALALMKRIGPEGFGGDVPHFTLLIREDWENPHDPDALSVVFRSNTQANEVRLGFIQNGDRQCPDCGQAYPKPIRANEAVLVCTECGQETKRVGLASRISEWLRSQARPSTESLKTDVAWENGGITGGGNAAILYGCNIRISARS